MARSAALALAALAVLAACSPPPKEVVATDETPADAKMTEEAINKTNDRIDALERKVSDLETEVAQLKSRTNP